MSETRDYCSYYVAYANSLGIAPQQVWVHDGENNVNYMSWIQARWGEWRALRRLASSAPLSAAHRADFEAWLAATFPAPSPCACGERVSRLPCPQPWDHRSTCAQYRPAPTPAEQMAIYERRRADYVAACARGENPPHPVRPHVPGQPTPPGGAEGGSRPEAPC